MAFIVAISGFILFQRSKRSSRNFPLCKQVVNRKISEFIARKLDFFTFNIPLTTETALRSFENQIMIIKRNGIQANSPPDLSSKETLYIFSHCLKTLVCVGYIYFSCSLCSVKKKNRNIIISVALYFNGPYHFFAVVYKQLKKFRSFLC